MCLKPIRQKSTSRYFSVHGYSKMLLEFPCGECAECKQMKRNEAYLRNYWQVKATHDLDGYVLFDTLTYREDSVPHASDFFACVPKDKDFMCFNPEHFKQFMDKLRKRLRRRGFNVVDNLSYYFVTEYGTSDTYTDPSGRVHQGTHRPHYHVLFYVTGSNKPDPVVLSDMISDCWSYGRTDGIRHHDRTYFNHNVFWKSCGDLRMRGLTMYLAKYITKDSDFQSVLDKRCDVIIAAQMQNQSLLRIAHDKFVERYSKKKWFKDSTRDVDAYVFSYMENNPHDYPSKFDTVAKRKALDERFIQYLREQGQTSKSNVVRAEKEKWFVGNYVEKYVRTRIDQFHHQSLHFGMYAIQGNNLDMDLIMREGMMRIPDKDRIWKYIPIPMYYARKLFYEKQRRVDGTEFWTPTDLGKAYLTKRTYANVVRVADKYADFMKNLPNHITDEDKRSKDVSNITRLLAGRSWTDFAEYLVFFKGRLYDPTEELDDADVIVSKSLDVDRTGAGAVFDLNELSDADERTIMEECVIDDSISPRFKGFDRLFGYMDYLMDISKRKKKQRLFDKKEYLEKKYKRLGLKVNYF